MQLGVPLAESHGWETRGWRKWLAPAKVAEKRPFHSSGGRGGEVGHFLLHRERYLFGWHRQHDIRHRLEVEVRHKAITHGENVKQIPLQLGGFGLRLAQCGLHEMQGQIGQHELLARGAVAGRNRCGFRQGMGLANKFQNSVLHTQLGS